MPDLRVQGTPEAVVPIEKSPDEGKTIKIKLHSVKHSPADNRKSFSHPST